jgi:DNA-directed RNA polymerase specialized sigma24 family protein
MAFPLTRGSVVAGLGDENPAAKALALERVAKAYWRPVFAHVRMRWAVDPDRASELTQEFFKRALERDMFGGFDPGKARFRTYVRMCVDRFAANHIKGERRLKRGGGARVISIEGSDDGEGMELPGLEGVDPESAFDVEWLRSLFEAAVGELEAFCVETKRKNRFDVFSRYVLDPPEGEKPSYAAVAGDLGLSVTDVTNYLFFARRELKRILLEKLRELTASEEEFRAEARAVLGMVPK